MIKDEMHACDFDLSIHHASEGKDGLLEKHLGTVVCAWITSARHLATAACVRVNRFATDLTRCAFFLLEHAKTTLEVLAGR